MKQGILQDMSKEDRNDFYIAIPIILAALLFILYYSLGNSSDLDEADYLIVTENTMNIDSITIGGDTYEPMTSLTDRRKIIAPQKIQNRLASKEVKSTIPGFNSMAEVDQNTASIASPTILTESIDTVHNLSDTIKTATIAKITDSEITPENPDSNPSTTASQSTQSDPPQDTIKSNPSSSKDCIIIIGAYGNATNVTRVMGKLMDEGYDAFTTPYKGLTRVGIYHTCDLKKLQATLQHLRKKYAKDAMVLNKK